MLKRGFCFPLVNGTKPYPAAVDFVLDINAEASPQQMFEQMSGNFGDDPSSQADDGFRQKPLRIASGVLKFMKTPSIRSRIPFNNAVFLRWCV